MNEHVAKEYACFIFSVDVFQVNIGAIIEIKYKYLGNSIHY